MLELGNSLAKIGSFAAGRGRFRRQSWSVVWANVAG
jgi:hypothetical protein